MEEVVRTAVLSGRLSKHLGGLIAHLDFGDNGLRSFDAEGVEEFSRPRHLGDDVTAAYELAADVELGNRGPRGKIFDALADVPIRKDVEGLVIAQVVVENRDNLGGETALGGLPVALHEEHHRVVLNQIVDLVAGRIVETHLGS